MSSIVFPRLFLLNLTIRFESYFGRKAYAHLFVTRAMRDFLTREWHLEYVAYSSFMLMSEIPPQRYQSRPP